MNVYLRCQRLKVPACLADVIISSGLVPIVSLNHGLRDLLQRRPEEKGVRNLTVKLYVHERG